MTIEPLHLSEIHVWWASLLLAAERVEMLCGELAPDEQARAGRMHTRDLSRRFIVARVVLRRLLAAYVPQNVALKADAQSLRDDAAALSFTYGPRGKPYLATRVAGANISFNLAHADDIAVYAVAIGRDVGIDIEATGHVELSSLRDDGGPLRDDRNTLTDVEINGIARKVFSTLECEALKALQPDERRAAFFRIWARKEAYIKAHGQGFGYPTRSFSVSHCVDDDALIGDVSAPDAPQRWRVIGLPAPRGFAMALAAEGRDWTVRRFDGARFAQVCRWV